MKLFTFELIRTNCLTLNKFWAWAVEQYIILVLLLAEQTVWCTTVCPVFQTLLLLGQSLFQIGEKGLWSAFDMGAIYLFMKRLQFPMGGTFSSTSLWSPVSKDRPFGPKNVGAQTSWKRACMHTHKHTRWCARCLAVVSVFEKTRKGLLRWCE